MKDNSRHLEQENIMLRSTKMRKNNNPYHSGPKPIIEEHPRVELVTPSRVEWSKPWTYLFFILSPMPPVVAWFMATGFVDTFIYMTAALAITACLIFLGIKSRILHPEEYETLIDKTYKYKHFCLKCAQFVGVHSKNASGITCHRCGSNRITLSDPLESGRF